MSCSFIERPLTAREELTITRAILYGVEFFYNDYGHPERKEARKYWTCSAVNKNGVIGWGHTQAQAALDWLRRSGLQGDLNVNKRA